MGTVSKLLIPDSFTFRETGWTVQLVKDMSNWEGDAAGRCTRHRNLISIDADLDQPEQELTYVHEVLHAIWPEGVCGERMQEKVIRALEGPLREAILAGVFRRVDEA